MINRKKKKIIKYAVMDTETGGFDPVDNALLEVAIVGIDEDFEVVSKIEFLIKPGKGKRVHQSALDVNKIKMNVVEEEGIDVEDINEVIEEWFGKNRIMQPLIPVGHNYIKFDQKFLRVNIPGYSRFFSSDPIDTLVASRKYVSNSSKMTKANLGAMRTEFGIEMINNHRAMDDALVNVEVFKKLVELGYCEVPEMA